ncbi:hypothetical protein [Thiomonas intermedia]|uniref:hypothetical protein n=1 Tax=Thiomonas intermedia TaxID=926 RepID=UPI0009A4BE60|nr:hypothetical protein [Thiomonas intermedia]
MADISEQYGRFDTKLDTLQESVNKIDGKVSKHESQIRWATAVVSVTVVLLTLIVGLYKLIESHLTIGWH